MTEYFYHRHVEREILSALLDGELGQEERRFVHEHLQQCDACRDAAVEFGAIKGMIGELPRLIAPEAFVSKALVRRRPSVRAVATSTLRGRRRWFVGGAAAAAVAVTLAGLVAPRPTSVPPIEDYMARHVSVSNGVDAGGQVLFAVYSR
jgi:anti-sigma factor RsiW